MKGYKVVPASPSAKILIGFSIFLTTKKLQTISSILFLAGLKSGNFWRLRLPCWSVEREKLKKLIDWHVSAMSASPYRAEFRTNFRKCVTRARS